MSNQTIWTGFKSNDWLNAQNWSKGVPSADRHAFIPSVGKATRHPIIEKNLKINFTLKNEGLLIIRAEIFIMSNGIFQNYGKTNTDAKGLVANQGNVLNFGEWINAGKLENNKIFTNQNRFFNEGSIENYNSLVNIGSIANTGIIDNHSVINNSGSLENFSVLNNHDKGVILDEGSISSNSKETLEDLFQSLEFKAPTSI